MFLLFTVQVPDCSDARWSGHRTPWIVKVYIGTFIQNHPELKTTESRTHRLQNRLRKTRKTVISLL